jgi:hypothetical protein
MTNEELLQSSSQISPKLFEKTATAMKLIERLNSDVVQELSQDITDILDVTQEKMAQYEKTKLAVSFSGAMRTMGDVAKKGGGVVGGGIGAALLTSIASDIYDSAKSKLTKAKNYSKIIQQNPELLQKFDKAKLQKSFNTLHNFAPEFTADPQLGAQLLNAMSETLNQGQQYQILRELLNSRKTLQDVKTNQFRPRFEFSSKKKDDRKNTGG